MFCFLFPFYPEEAVNDVKRQAMVELQKALSAADQKAAELVSAERAKMERAISETRKQTQTELLRSLNHQEESAEVKLQQVLHSKTAV